MMKRLSFVLAQLVVLALFSAALAQGQVDYRVTFPKYALVVTDMSAVDWDFTLGTEPAGGKAQYTDPANGIVYKAWKGGLTDCLTAKINSLGRVTPQDTAGSTSISTTCYFAPSSVSLGGPVSVDWSNYNPVAPDGTLVVITNAANFRVSAQVTTDWANLTGASLLVLNDATDNGATWLSGTTPTVTSYATVSSASATVLVDTSTPTGLYKPTNFTNVYAVPTIWMVSFDPTAQPNISTADVAVVTFTGTALP